MRLSWVSARSKPLMMIWAGRDQDWWTGRDFSAWWREYVPGLSVRVFCLEASRLARNGRDWHHLIDLCGLVGTLLIDPEGMYDPRLSNDRLLLGLRGSMSEFELNILRPTLIGRDQTESATRRAPRPSSCWIQLDREDRARSGSTGPECNTAGFPEVRGTGECSSGPSVVLGENRSHFRLSVTALLRKCSGQNHSSTPSSRFLKIHATPVRMRSVERNPGPMYSTGVPTRPKVIRRLGASGWS